MRKPKIAVQLFCVRGECERSLASTLLEAAKIGFEGAEPWGYKGDTLTWMKHPVADIRTMYDDSGLRCCGLHLSTVALMGNSLARTIEFSRVLGNRFLIIAGDGQRMSSAAGIRELAGILNGAAEKLEAHGMYTGYHAHPSDFVKVEGKPAWDTLFGLVQPRVIMQVDIGNMLAGGADPAAILRKFPDRARSVHVKDFGGPAGAAVGEGTVNWTEIFGLCESLHKTEWYVVEQGEAEGKGFDIVGRSLDATARFLRPPAKG
jgi:sugar phosphate isomerase/epimerase